MSWLQKFKNTNTCTDKTQKLPVMSVLSVPYLEKIENFSIQKNSEILKQCTDNADKANMQFIDFLLNALNNVDPVYRSLLVEAIARVASYYGHREADVFELIECATLSPCGTLEALTEQVRDLELINKLGLSWDKLTWSRFETEVDEFCRVKKCTDEFKREALAERKNITPAQVLRELTDMRQST